MDSRISLRWLTLLVLLAISIYLCWRMLQPFVNVLLWAGVLAVVFAPVDARIEKRLKSPGWSAAISTLLVVVTILGPVTFITFAVIGELRGAAAGIETWALPSIDPNTPVIGPVIRWLGAYVDLEEFRSPQFLRQRLESWSGGLASGTLGLVGGAFTTAAQTLLVVFTLYYLFRDGKAIRSAAFDIVPIERAQAREILQRTQDVIAASVYGVVMISAIQGALGFFIFWALGLPSALLWGIVMFFLSMIPMAGAFVVWAPAAVYLAVTGLWGKAAVLTVWGILVVGSIDNVLSPRLVGRRARMHELLIFFAVLGGIQVFGVLGVVLGPVVVAVTLALLEIVRQANRPPEQTVREETLLEQQADIRLTG